MHLSLKAFSPLVLLSLFLITAIPSMGQSSELNSEAANSQATHEELSRGERFFKGLLPVNRKFEACESCHNIHHSDTMNWNPSAMDIALKYKDKDFAAFQGAVMQPNGVKMEQVHKNFEIEENDLKTIKVYLDKMAITGPPKVGPTVTQILLFSGLILLMLLALLDLLFFHVIRFRVVHVLVLFITLGLVTKIIVTAAVDLGRTQNYAPDQPIKFSHKIHAGDNRIDCKYCHHTAEFDKSAGIPSMNLCMNCHVLVREGSHSGKFEINKVIEANETQKPVEWVRIHNLPDHVFFSHAQHVGIAKVDCKQCHGPVAEMNIMRQQSDLSMGWCINCHRQTKVDFKDNAYYDNYKELHEMLKSGKIDTIRAVDIGANDCMRCHY
jgi:cytochrome c553